jgi:CheY-like chemotaxis protein
MSMLEAHPFLLASSSGIRLANSSAEAERALASGFRPSVVLLDVRADRAGGEAFARRVAADPTYSEIPILGITGSRDRLRLTLMNDACSLSSPSELPELLEILEEICFALPA